MRNIFKDRRNWPALLLLLTILGIWTVAVAQQGNQVIATGASGIAANGPGIPSSAGTTYYASNFGLPSTGFSSCNTTMTSSGTSVTNLSTDPLYIKGYQIYGTSQACQSFDATGIYCVTLQTIASVSNGGHTATFATPGNASGSCATVQGQTWWFPATSTTALQNAFLASLGQNTTYQGACGNLEIPPGIWAIDSSIGTTAVSPCGNDNLVLGRSQTDYGHEVHGAGVHSTVILILPTFDGASAITPAGCANATILFSSYPMCTFGAATVRDMSVDFGGYTATPNLSGKCIFQIGNVSTLLNLGVYNGPVQSGGPTLNSFCINGQTNGVAYATNLQDYAGSVTSVAGTGSIVIDRLQQYEGAGGAVGNATLLCSGLQPTVMTNSYIQSPNVQVAVSCSNAVIKLTDNSFTSSLVGNSGTMTLSGAGDVIYSTNNKITCSTGTLGSCFTFAGGTSTVYEVGDSATGGINTFLTTGTTGNAVFDMGGNTYSPSVRRINPNTGVITWNGGGGPASSISIQAQLSGAGACVASQTLFLFPYGQTATSTCSSATAQTQIGGYVAPRTGTLEYLNLTLTTGGIAGDAVTVLKNGTTTAMTCTFGTGTSCQDLTHTVAVALGDLIGFQITTGVAETAVAPKASVVLF